MFGFLIKKTFFDMWDNLFKILLINIGCLIISLLSLLIGSFLYNLFLDMYPNMPIIMLFGTYFLIFLAMFSLIFTYLGAASVYTQQIADSKQPKLKDFFIAFKKTILPSLIFAIINVAVISIIFVAAQFYLSYIKNFFGYFIFFVILWIYVFWLVAGQYFFPLQSKFDKNPIKNIKKMFLLLLDNLGFTFALFLVSIVTLILSGFTFFLFMGPGAILLWHNTALKLRLYKYDYIEKNKNANRKKIPWDTLLEDDIDKLGKRTLKGLIFPWKD